MVYVPRSASHTFYTLRAMFEEKSHASASSNITSHSVAKSSVEAPPAGTVRSHLHSFTSKMKRSTTTSSLPRWTDPKQPTLKETPRRPQELELRPDDLMWAVRPENTGKDGWAGGGGRPSPNLKEVKTAMPMMWWAGRFSSVESRMMAERRGGDIRRAALAELEKWAVTAEAKKSLTEFVKLCKKLGREE